MTLGSRIKTLRKQKKLTLEQLAGSKLTKGMLSLIENDKAKPSLESLEHIAKKLEIELNELLQEKSISELREELQQVESYYLKKEYDKVINYIKADKEWPLYFESGRIFELYGLSLYHNEDDKWERYLNAADQIYMELSHFDDSANLTIKLVKINLNSRKYERAYHLLLNKQTVFKEMNAKIDTMNEIAFNYYKISLLFALGRYDEASNQLEVSFAESRQKGLFYKIDDLYRLACFYSMMIGNFDEMRAYLKKLESYSIFAESKEIKGFIYVIQAHYYNHYEKDHEAAISLIDKFKTLFKSDQSSGWKTYYVMEKGKALYHLKQYENALEHLLLFKEIPEWVHPFDLSIMYEIYAYIANCYVSLNQRDLAYKYAEKAFSGVYTLPSTPYKQSIKKTFDYIKDYLREEQ